MVDKLAYSVKEVSEAIGVSLWRAKQEIYQGRIAVVKIGTRTVVPWWSLKKRLETPEFHADYPPCKECGQAKPLTYGRLCGACRSFKHDRPSARRRYATNPEFRDRKNADSKRRYNLRRTSVEAGRFPPDWKEAKRLLQANLCSICHTDLNGEEHEHHIQPLSRGGKDEPANIVLTHGSCNLKVGNKLPSKYIEERGLICYEDL